MSLSWARRGGQSPHPGPATGAFTRSQGSGNQAKPWAMGSAGHPSRTAQHNCLCGAKLCSLLQSRDLTSP